MEPLNVVIVDADQFNRTAEEKGRDRLALAAMPPEVAQSLVTSLPRNGDSWVDVTPEDRWTLGGLEED